MPEAYYMELGRRIARARTNAGLTQTELAELLDRERSSVANMESGRQRCLAGALVTIARLLKVDAGWLLTGNGDGVLLPTLIAPKDVLRQADELMRVVAQLYRAERGLRELAAEQAVPS